MLALLGLVTIALLLTVIMTKWMSPLMALILIPIAAALIGGFGWDTSKFIVSGIQSLAPVVGMFVFAILFFGIMTDAGMLDPIIDRILKTVGTRPTRIVMGTTLLALLVHLDGSGAVTFLITIPAMLPLYERLGLDKRILACAASMAAGVNFLPWTGPMIRASASLKLPIPEIFNPLVPIQAIGLVFIFTVAWWLGKREERRLGLDKGAADGVVPTRTLTEAEKALRQPQNFWINIALTIVVMGTMVVLGDKLAPAIVFMVGTCLALLINYRDVDMQRQRIDAHARAALLDGLHPARRRRVHRHHAEQRHAEGDGADGGGVRSGGHGEVHADRPRRGLHAPQPAVRSRLVLLRRPAGHRRGRRPARRAEGAVRPGRAARPDDDRLSGEPADARDLPGRRPLRHRARRPSAVHDPVSVRRVDRDDDRLRRARHIPSLKTGEAMRTIRVGSGAGYSGDRIEPAVELAEKGGLDYLVFECLAERTIALAQQVRMKDPNAGYDPLLAARMRAVLAVCARNKVKIVTNMGAANPAAAAEATRAIARELGLKGLKVAAVTGDDVFAYLHDHDVALDNGKTIAAMGNSVISANAYIGVAPIVEALKGGADVVITGRAADPAIFMAPLIAEFGWAMDDWTMLGRGVLVGHLLECAGQVTGGYFADPGVKDVPDLARLGFPIGEVREDGELVVTKVAGSGGAVTARTVKEQLLYEIHDPKAYLQPDVIADFSDSPGRGDRAGPRARDRRQGRAEDRPAQDLGRLCRQLCRRRPDLLCRSERRRPGKTRARHRARTPGV